MDFTDFMMLLSFGGGAFTLYTVQTIIWLHRKTNDIKTKCWIIHRNWKGEMEPVQVLKVEVKKYHQKVYKTEEDCQQDIDDYNSLKDALKTFGHDI